MSIDYTTQSINGTPVPNAFRFYQLAARIEDSMPPELEPLQFDLSDKSEEEPLFMEPSEEPSEEPEEEPFEEPEPEKKPKTAKRIYTPPDKNPFKKRFKAGYKEKTFENAAELTSKHVLNRCHSVISLDGLDTWLVSTLTSLDATEASDIFSTPNPAHVALFAIEIFYRKLGMAPMSLLRGEFFAQRGCNKYQFSASDNRFFITWCIATNEKVFLKMWITSTLEAAALVRKGETPPMYGRIRNESPPVDVVTCIRGPRVLSAYGFLSLDTDESFLPRTKYYNYNVKMYIPCVMTYAEAERLPHIGCNMVTITTYFTQTGTAFYCNKNSEFTKVSKIYTPNEFVVTSHGCVRKYNVFAISWQAENWTPFTRSFYPAINGCSHDEYMRKYPIIFNKTQ